MGFARLSSNGMFSQRHYLAIAKRLNNNYRRYKSLDMEWAFAPLDDITKQLSDMFQSDNPNFKPNKFMGAVMEGLDEN